ESEYRCQIRHHVDPDADAVQERRDCLAPSRSGTEAKAASMDQRLRLNPETKLPERPARSRPFCIVAALSRERSVLAQHVAGQIEGSGNQNSRWWVKIELARGVKRLGEIVSACRRNADSTRNVRHRFRRHARFDARHRYCN